VYVAPMSARRFLQVQIGVGAVIAIVCLMGRLRRWRQPTLLTTTLSLSCCWMTAFGPTTESSTYILLAPVVAWAMVESDSRESGQVWRWAYLAVYVILAVSQAAIWFGKKGDWYRDHLQPQPVGGTLLLMILLTHAVWGMANSRGPRRVITAA